MKNPKIQINKSLYDELIMYFLNGDRSAERERRILSGIDEDIEARIRRDYYSRYKTDPSAEAREKARQAYLESAGIPRDFRW